MSNDAIRSLASLAILCTVAVALPRAQHWAFFLGWACALAVVTLPYWINRR